MALNMALPVLPGQAISSIGGTNLQRPFVRKTIEELHNEHLNSLVQDRDFHQPTISYLAKCNKIKLPILCDKCLETATANDEYVADEYNHDYESDTLKPIVGSYLAYLTPCGTCEYNKKMCILYNKRKKSFVDATSPRSPSASYHTSPLPNSRNSMRQLSANLKSASIKSSQSATLSTNSSPQQNKIDDEYVETTYKSVKHVKIDVRPATASPIKTQSSYNVNRNSNSSSNSPLSNYSPTLTKKKNVHAKIKDVEPPMMEGDIRYKYTKSGLEIKRLNAKNSLIIDIFTPDVCKDRNEKSYSEWLDRQKEDENRKNQKYPSQIYEKQLQEVLSNFKKGPLRYEDWARQSYDVLILKHKIKRAKKLEAKERNEKLNKAKEQEILNTFNLWKISKEFARYRNTSNNSNLNNHSSNSFNANKK